MGKAVQPMKKTTCFAFLSFLMRRVRLTDACLMIFMGILMIQSAHNLFFYELAGENGSDVDVIIRTTSAAIFGYFIGAGFLREDPEEQEKKPEATANLSRNFGSRSQNESTIPIKTTFATGVTQMKPESSPMSHFKRLHRQQIVIVAAIGIFSLLMLVMVNHCISDLPVAAIATVSQFRDFVSGSVGLLIGNASRGKM